MRQLLFISILALPAAVLSDPGVLVEAANDTVMKIKYTGGSPTGSGPVVAISGKKVGASSVVNSTSGARGLIGTVASHAISSSSSTIGVAGAGYFGVWGKGQTGVMGEGDEYYGAVGVEGVSREGHYNTGVSGGAESEYGAEATGVLAWANGAEYAYGIYAMASGGNQQSWAGYFSGNVAITGVCSPCTISDEKFKKNIVDLNDGLSKVMALRPKSYEMRTEEFKDVNLSAGHQQGFLAADLKKVMPEVVHPITAPTKLTAEEAQNGVRKDPVTYMGVNYAAMIPTLVKAIQEQQAEIEALKRLVGASQ